MSRDHLTTSSRQKATLNKNERGALTVQNLLFGDVPLCTHP